MAHTNDVFCITVAVWCN